MVSRYSLMAQSAACLFGWIFIAGLVVEDDNLGTIPHMVGVDLELAVPAILVAGVTGVKLEYPQMSGARRPHGEAFETVAIAISAG